MLGSIKETRKAFANPSWGLWLPLRAGPVFAPPCHALSRFPANGAPQWDPNERKLAGGLFGPVANGRSNHAIRTFRLSAAKIDYGQTLLDRSSFPIRRFRRPMCHGSSRLIAETWNVPAERIGSAPCSPPNSKFTFVGSVPSETCRP